MEVRKKVTKYTIILFIKITCTSLIALSKYSDSPPSQTKSMVKSMYVVTACDSRFYTKLLNLVGSLHRVNFNELGELAVFDLGLTSKQRHHLRRIKKLRIYNVEPTHPDLLKHFVTSPRGYRVRGWYAWKPIVIKQALEKWPCILYIDSGATILQPLNSLFEHIRTHNYFLIDMCAHNIRVATTKFVIEHLNLTQPGRQSVLHDNTYCISAGLQGLTRAMYEPYVKPIYKLTRNLRYFADDGSAEAGFGRGRHDQVIFSIYAHLLQLKPFKTGTLQLFDLPNQKVPFQITHDKKEIIPETIIYQSRQDISKLPYYKKYIRYKSRLS